MRRGLIPSPVQQPQEAQPITFDQAADNTAQQFGQDFRETAQNVGQVYPVAETAANLVTQSYGVPLSGLAGLFALPFGADTANSVVQGVQNALIYQPQTEGGKQVTDVATTPFQEWEKGAEWAASGIKDPALQTAVKTGISAAPAILAGAKTIKSGTVELGAATKFAIRKGINKGIRPSVAGKRTRSQIEQYHQKAQIAVEEIIKNKDNLKLVDETGAPVQGLPKTLDQFSQAVEQTKRQIFERYDSLAKEAGRGGVDVNLVSIANEVANLIDSKTIRDFSPETTRYGLKRMEALKSRGKYGTLETQEAIKLLNQTLEAFYRDPSPKMQGRAAVDALIANNLRKQLDSAIQNATGKEYATLKKQYGAFLEIERDVSRRAMVDARKNNKGLIDFSDIYTGFHMAKGVFGAEPSTLAAGFVAKGVSKYLKALNDPNRTVKNMFSGVEKLNTKKFTPKSVKAPVAATIATTQVAGKEKPAEINLGQSPSGFKNDNDAGTKGLDTVLNIVRPVYSEQKAYDPKDYPMPATGSMTAQRATELFKAAIQSGNERFIKDVYVEVMHPNNSTDENPLQAYTLFLDALKSLKGSVKDKKKLRELNFAIRKAQENSNGKRD